MKLMVLRFSFLCFFVSFFNSYSIADKNPQEYIEYAQHVLIKEDSETILKSLFCPVKQSAPVPLKVLLGLIYNEKKSIKLAQFVITHDEIVEALCQALKKGVEVKIIIDKGSRNYPTEKITKLHENGIEIFNYKRKYSSMHNKFYVFEENFFGKPVVWMGSANATVSGFHKNEESIAVCNDADFVQNYKTRFETIKQKILDAKNSKHTIGAQTIDILKIVNTSKKVFKRFSWVIR